jgi:hypothetical protein
VGRKGGVRLLTLFCDMVLEERQSVSYMYGVGSVSGSGQGPTLERACLDHDRKAEEAQWREGREGLVTLVLKYVISIRRRMDEGIGVDQGELAYLS